MKISLLAALLFFLVQGEAFAGLDEGIDSYQKGDYKAALNEWKPLAEEGNVIAQNNLGVMFANGQGVPQDYKEAAKWYEKAAEQGYESSQFNLGLMYNIGQGVPQDYHEAVKWYEKAAKQGYANAQNNLGFMHYHGHGVPQDKKEAYAWWDLAASQGHIAAFNNRYSVAKEMTSAEITEAKELSKAYLKKYGAGSNRAAGSQEKAETPNKKMHSPVLGRYLDNGDGTMTDTRTGLMWTKNDSYNDAGKCKDWNAAKSSVSRLSTGGHNDWRLPTIKELKVIYRNDRSLHANKLFADEGASMLWSSEEAGSCCARIMVFSSGDIVDGRRNFCINSGVRAVRMQR